MATVKSVKVNYEPRDDKADFAFGNIASRYGATHRYITYDGKPVIILAGEFHYSRYDSRLWEIEILKMKAQGLNCISTYVFWNHHERKCGSFDFSGNNDVELFIRLCKKHGMKVILRIGPWCHGEVKRGGFSDYTALIAGKRNNTPVYLYFVKRFWAQLADRIKQYFDGETVICVQLENEYGGSIGHIVRLREIAEQCGIKTPFFAMTAWPTNTPDGRFLPLFGGYPEAPWTQHKRPLKPEGRFAITEGRSEIAIGEDLLGKQRSGADFSSFPYALCETGTGNQVTQHRRPLISENDGYGVAFAKLASGAVWLGYYMYHGGRNPSDKPMQESRRTFYPNDYPIVDYDFQAPISKDGDVRGHADRLRLLHYFLLQNQEKFARTQTFFSKDRTMPYFSYRADENGGYVFLSNYERGASLKDENVDIDVVAEHYRVNVKGLEVPAGAMFFFPVMQKYGGVTYDYVTAQPVAQTEENGEKHVYFVKYGREVRISVKGNQSVISTNTLATGGEDNKCVMHFLTPEEAKKLYVVSGRVVFSDFPLFEKDNKLYAEEPTRAGKNCVDLKRVDPVKLPFDTYMFSSGKREFYRLSFDNGILDEGDVEVTLAFNGLNLQIFKNQKLVDDCFNIDGKCVFRLARIVGEEKGRAELTIRACAATARGKGNVYNETGIVPGQTQVSVHEIKKITINEVKL